MIGIRKKGNFGPAPFTISISSSNLWRMDEPRWCDAELEPALQAVVDSAALDEPGAEQIASLGKKLGPLIASATVVGGATTAAAAPLATSAKVALLAGVAIATVGIGVGRIPGLWDRNVATAAKCGYIE